ncbi:MAG: ImmA/IrrE family metallo-endopeptidase [Acidobacteria bacterium]|nr:ImmA/IrrE family metallo-endopeptidase [Gammaproteobacteria bacterium]MYK79640.1 ImmA/IrrE family metallo-endopeptidase [Acidobacteriota bacterium]
MTSDRMAINPKLIRWARKRAGYSLEAAELYFRDIRAWESRQKAPTYVQLESVALRFGVPVSVLFFPEPPDVPEPSRSFRTLPDREFATLPPRMHLLVRKAQAFHLSLVELTEGRSPAERPILRTFQNKEPDPAEVRATLGVSLNDQRAWADPAEAFRGWRDALHDAGVFVFKDAFRQYDYCGFSLYDAELPVIYVNSSRSATRQIFTLFHELGHLLHETSGLDPVPPDVLDRLPTASRNVETQCNRFAADLLLPPGELDRLMADDEPTESTATRIAGDLNLSREMVYRHFLDHGWITLEAYRDARERWNVPPAKSGAGGNSNRTLVTYLGTHYLDMAFAAYYRNRLDENGLADALGVKPARIPKLERLLYAG